MAKLAFRYLLWLGLVLAVVVLAAGIGLQTAAPHYASKQMSMESWLFVDPGHTLVSESLLRINPGVLADRAHTTTIGLISAAVPRTLLLLVAVAVIATIVGVPLGVWASSRPGQWLARLILSSTAVGVAIPGFLAAFFLKLFVIEWYVRTGTALLPTFGFGLDSHVVLPTLALAAGPVAYITRVTYLTMTDVLGQDYIRTAHSKGLRERVVVWGHAVPNSAALIVQTIGSSLRVSLTSMPIIEYLFSWPGVGLTLLQSVLLKDIEALVWGIAFFGLAFVLLNWVVQGLSWMLNPVRMATSRTAR